MTTRRAWNFQDLTGRQFGRLVVRDYAGKAKTHAMWQCACECVDRAVTTPVRSAP